MAPQPPPLAALLLLGVAELLEIAAELLLGGAAELLLTLVPTYNSAHGF
jgi:hypothetical protein